MITGSIRDVSITPVEAGQTLKATVDYVATNPGALYWKTWLIAVCSTMGLKKVLDETREIGEDGGRVKTYSLGTMPDQSIVISFFLFASDSASASWSWSAFDSWMYTGYGLPTGVVYLGSAYESADPAPPALPDPEFRNLSIWDVTSPVDVGDSCDITCLFQYRGPAIVKTFYVAIGNNGTWGFDEILHASIALSMPESADWVSYYPTLAIKITSALDPNDSPYDVYAKLTGTGNDLISEVANNVLVMSGPTIPDPEYRGLQITGYDSGVEPGGYCTVQVKFQYRGPAGTKTLYSAIGNKGTWGFDEILHASKLLSIPESVDWRDINADVSIYIGTGIDPDQSPYDLYAKLTGTGNDISSSVLENVITVIGEDPVPDAEFRNLSIIDYTPSVAQGGHCTVQVRYEYRGPAITKTLYAAAGNNGWIGFDEIVHGSVTLNIEETLDWDYKTAQVQVPITSALDPNDSPYDLYAKLTGQSNDIESPVLENVLTVEGGGYPDPEFQQLQLTSITSPVQIGGTCWVKVSFQYRGPAIDKDLYVAIGNSGFFGFDEIIHASGVMHLEPLAEWGTVVSELAIEITEALDPSESPYDVYAKITGPGNDLTSPAREDAVEIQEGTGTGGITGAITSAKPLEFEVTAPIEILVSYNAYCDDTALQVTGWATRVKIELDGMSQSVEENHTGRDGSATDVVIALGNMPDKTLSGKVILEAQGDGDWEQLYAKAISVYPPGAGPGEEGGIPGLAWGLAAVLIIAAASSGSSSSPAKAKKSRK